MGEIHYPKIDCFNLSRGIEKENLRVHADGSLAQSPHPAALGSALCNEYITTDFAECLPEMVTKVHQSMGGLLQELEHIQHFLYQSLPEDEYLWPASMPPFIADENAVPIAAFGSSNVGQMKHIYRLGLSHRYGRVMQAIAGIHYNVSFDDALFEALRERKGAQVPLQDFKNQSYMALIRRFLDHQWLLLYLFGASPVAMESSVGTRRPCYLQQASEYTWVVPDGTSLRLSPFGYQNTPQGGIYVNYNSVAHYGHSLLMATCTPSIDFASIKTVEQGGREQLNDSLIQIENEYYNTIRPKPVMQANTMPALSLLHQGVDYVEVRLFDLNPYEPLGVNQDQLAFCDVFLTWCLLKDEQRLSDADMTRISGNVQQVLINGHHPKKSLTQSNGKQVCISEALETMMAELEPVAHWMDEHAKEPIYTRAFHAQQQKIAQSDTLPAKRVLKQLESQSYENMMANLGEDFKARYANKTLESEVEQTFVKAAQDSIKQQQALEDENKDQSLEDFYRQYRSQAATFFTDKVPV